MLCCRLLTWGVFVLFSSEMVIGLDTKVDTKDMFFKMLCFFLIKRLINLP